MMQTIPLRTNHARGIVSSLINWEGGQFKLSLDVL